MTDRRRRQYITEDCDFLVTKGRALIARWGHLGITIWLGFKFACQLANVQGQLRWHTETEAKALLGLDGIPLVDNLGTTFTIAEFFAWTGRRHWTRTTRQRRDDDASTTVSLCDSSVRPGQRKPATTPNPTRPASVDNRKPAGRRLGYEAEPSPVDNSGDQTGSATRQRPEHEQNSTRKRPKNEPRNRRSEPKNTTRNLTKLNSTPDSVRSQGVEGDSPARASADAPQAASASRSGRRRGKRPSATPAKAETPSPAPTAPAPAPAPASEPPAAAEPASASSNGHPTGIDVAELLDTARRGAGLAAPPVADMPEQRLPGSPAYVAAMLAAGVPPDKLGLPPDGDP